jgi:hypothetical protein
VLSLELVLTTQEYMAEVLQDPKQSQLNSRVDSIRSALASAGLSYKTTNARYTRGQGPAQFAAVMAEWANVKSFNANQLSKANEINTLQQGFGLTGYIRFFTVTTFIARCSSKTR